MARWTISDHSFHNSAVPDEAHSKYHYLRFDDSAKYKDKKTNKWMPYQQLLTEFKHLKDMVAFFELIPNKIKKKLNYSEKYKTDPANLNTYFCYCGLNNPIRSKFFLALVNKFEPMSDDIKNNVSIFTNQDLTDLDELSKLIVDLNTAEQILIKLKVEKLKSQNKDNDFIFAYLTKQAHQSTNPDAFFNLGQYYQNFENSLQKALDCYQEIPEENPNFKSANLKSAEIMLQVCHGICPNHSYKAKLTPEELDDLLEKEDLHLSFLLDAKNPNYQKAVDQLFAEFSGDKGLDPIFKNVKANGETVVKLGRNTQKARAQIESLQTEVQQLKEKVARLQQQESLNASLIKRLHAQKVSAHNKNAAPYSPGLFTKPAKDDAMEIDNKPNNTISPQNT